MEGLPTGAKVKDFAKGKATTIGLTGALGSAMMGALNIYVEDASTHESLAMMVPFISVALAEVCKFIFSLFHINPINFSLRRRLNKKIRLMKKELALKNTSEDRKADLAGDIQRAQDALYATYD